MTTAAKPRVLLVEDEASVARAIVDYLSSKGIDIHHVPDLAGARRAIAAESFAVILLDWMLPDGEGPDLLREHRGPGRVIFLTARTELTDRVVGLELGADDYITKPFEPRELLARVHVQLRRHAPQSSPPPAPLPGGPFAIDTTRREARYKGELLELTKLEFELLHLLVREAGRVFSRDELLNLVWGYDNYPSTRTVDTHVFSLRQKSRAEHFVSVRGIGYRFIADPDAAESTKA
ncbi:MAG: response regulator transcription factor [Polyangiaceae bacterium]|nr:response regulator transcription factor [Polyangiaceae bacterium]